MIYILLPAYNEEESLPVLLPKIRSELQSAGEDYLVVICDDGSKDRTTELIRKFEKKMPIHTIRHKINRGLGETMRDLFEYAAETSGPGDIIIRMDCDDTHEPKFMPSLLAKARAGYDVVICSRFQPGGGQVGVNAYRSFISRCANIFMSVFFHIRGIRDYSCGYRAYRAEIIQEAIQFYGNNFIQLKGLGFTGTLEKLIKLKILGARFGEVPFMLQYDQKRSASKMVSSITTLGYLTMAICYHWPWNGWRRGYREKRKEIGR